MMVYTDPLEQYEPQFKPFLNDTYGIAMNQTFAFGGTPELIHDGTDNAGWTGAVVAGTWDFSDTTNPSAGSNCVSLTSGDNLDLATFSDGTETDMSTHSAIHGKIRLDTYSQSQNTITLQFLNNAVNEGNSVLIDTYIDTSITGSYQSFVIPMADLGLTASTVDQCDLIVGRTGGVKPTFRVDEWQIEETGDPIEFKVTTDKNTKYRIDGIRFLITDNVTGAAGQSYNKILGLAKLANGITFVRQLNGVVKFSTVFRQMQDLRFGGVSVQDRDDDGTNTSLMMEVKFDNPIIINGSDDTFLRLSIADDLSSLIAFQATAIGALVTTGGLVAT